MSRPAFMNIKTISGSIAATRMGQAVPIVSGAPTLTAFANPVYPPVYTFDPPLKPLVGYTDFGYPNQNATLNWGKPVDAISVTWTFYATAYTNGINGTYSAIATGTTSLGYANISFPAYPSGSYFGYVSVVANYAGGTSAAVNSPIVENS